MARPSTVFTTKLRKNQRLRIEKEIKRNRDRQYVERLRAVIWSSEGKTCSEIGQLLNRHCDTVRLWIKDYIRFGFTGLEVGKSSGRPPLIDVEGEACLHGSLANNPRDLGYPFTRWTLATLAEHLYRELHVRVTPGTVSRALVRLGYRYKRPKHSLRHRQDRRDVRRAKKARGAALKKFDVTRTDTYFSSKTNANSTSIPA